MRNKAREDGGTCYCPVKFTFLSIPVSQLANKIKPHKILSETKNFITHCSDFRIVSFSAVFEEEA